MCPQKRRQEIRHILQRRPCEGRGRNSGDAATAGVSQQPPEAKGGVGGCSLEPREGGQSCEHLDFSPVKHDSDIKKEYISVF